MIGYRIGRSDARIGIDTIKRYREYLGPTEMETSKQAKEKTHHSLTYPRPKLDLGPGKTIVQKIISCHSTGVGLVNLY